MMKKLTILIPVYNEEKYIEETLCSLKNQTYKNFQCLVSDNNSTDKTSQICQDFVEKNNNFKYFKQVGNIGSAQNTNFLLSRINTEFAMLFSGHDIIEPYFIEKIIKVLEENNEISLAFSQAIAIDENNLILSESAVNVSYNFTSNSLSRYIQSIKELDDCTIVQGIFRSKFLKNFQLPLHCIGPDHVLLSNLLWYGKLYIVNEILYKRRFFNTRKENALERINGEKSSEHLGFYNMFKAYLDNFNNLYQGPDEFRQFLNNKILDILTQRFGISKLYSEKSFSIKE